MSNIIHNILCIWKPFPICSPSTFCNIKYYLQSKIEQPIFLNRPSKSIFARSFSLPDLTRSARVFKKNFRDCKIPLFSSRVPLFCFLAFRLWGVAHLFSEVKAQNNSPAPLPSVSLYQGNFFVCRFRFSLTSDCFPEIQNQIKKRCALSAGAERQKSLKE